MTIASTTIPGGKCLNSGCTSKLPAEYQSNVTGNWYCGVCAHEINLETEEDARALGQHPVVVRRLRTTFKDWFKDDPIPVPIQLLALGFEDTSWHNDGMPSMTWYPPGAGLGVRAWIGSEVTKREFGELYVVETVEVDDRHADTYNTHNRANNQVHYNGDDLYQVIDTCCTLVEAIRAGTFQ